MIRLHIYDFVANISWTRIKQETALSRVGHSSVLLNENYEDNKSLKNKGDNQLMIFGGGDNDGEYFNDITFLSL